MDDYMKLPHYEEAVSTYNHIIKLVSAGKKMPPISLSKGEEILRSLKSSVMDLFSVTSLHFLHLGEEGVLHFVFLLNAIISHINSSSVAELNTVWANILFKGGHKDRGGAGGGSLIVDSSTISDFGLQSTIHPKIYNLQYTGKIWLKSTIFA